MRENLIEIEHTITIIESLMILHASVTWLLRPVDQKNGATLKALKWKFLVKLDIIRHWKRNLIHSGQTQKDWSKLDLKWQNYTEKSLLRRYLQKLSRWTFLLVSSGPIHALSPNFRPIGSEISTQIEQEKNRAV